MPNPNLDPTQTLRALEENPKFAALPYASQKRLRAKAFIKAYEGDSRFLSLPDERKEALLSAYTSKPPVFENPQVAKEAQALLTELKTGDATGGFRAFMETFSYNNPLYRGWMWWSYARPKYLPLPGDGENAALVMEGLYDSLYGRDGSKFREWAAEANPNHGLARFFGGVTKVGTELFALKSLPFMKTAQATSTAAIEKLVASTTLRSQAVRGVLGNFATNTLEAVGLTAADMVGKVWEGGPEKWNLEEVARTYGENAIIDYAIGTATGVLWPFVKITGKSLKETFLPRGKGSVTKDIIGSADLDRFISKAVTGELPPEVAERLPRFYSDQARALGYMQEFQGSVGRDPGLLNESPFYRASITARMAGMELGLDEKGFPNLRKIDEVMDGVDKPVSFKTLGDVHEHIAETLADLIEAKPKLFKVADYGPEAPLIESVLARRAALRVLPETKGRMNALARGYVTGNEASSLVGGDGKGFLVKRGEGEALMGALVRDPAGDGVALIGKTAPVEEVALALKGATIQKTSNPVIRESARERVVDALRRAGYDSALFPDGRLVSLYKGAVLPIKELSGAPSIGRGTRRASEAGFDAFVNVETSKFFKDAELASDPKKAAILISGRGPLTGDRVRAYAQEVLRASGKGGAVVEIESVPGGKGLSATWDAVGERLHVRVPEEGIPVEARREALKGLTKTLKEALPESKVPGTFSRSVGRALRKVEIPGESFEAQKAWASDNVAKLAGKPLEALEGGRYKIGDAEYGSLDEVADYLVTSRLTPDVVRVALAEEGLRWGGVRGAYTVHDAGGKVIAKGTTVMETLNEMGWRPSKLPSELMPSIAVVDGGAKLTYTKSAVMGSYPELMRYMDKFENFKVEEGKRILARTPDSLMYSLPTRKFEIVVPGAGIRETFETAKEASWFLRGGWAQYEGVMRVARRKGLDLSVENGAYVAHIGGETLRAPFGDKRALERMLKRLPDPQTLPSLIGEEAEALMRDHGIEMGPMGPLVSPSNPPSFEPLRKVGPLATAAHLYPTPLTRFIENGLAKTGHPAILKSFDKLVDRFRVFNGEHTKWRKLVKEAISPGGKTLPDKKLIGLRWWMEAANDEARAGVVKEFGLTETDLGVGEALRDIWGRNPGDGLYGLFGIDPFKYVTDYVPRLRKAVSDMKAKGMDLEPQNIFAHAFPNSVPRELKFFAEMDRLSEVLNFDAEDNVALLMDRYITQGLKKHYLNPIWREFDAARREASRAGTFDANALNPAIDAWRETVMGYKTPGEKAVEHFTERFMGRLGVKNPALTKDITRTLFTSQAFGTMAWKGWNVTRNVAQIYTTFGSTYGVTEATHAMREVAQNALTHIANAKRRGILLDTPPLINSIVDERGFWGKLVHKGLAAFKASDDFTRTAAMVGGDRVFDDAARKLARGVLKSPEDFLVYSKAYRFSEGAQGEIVELLKAGKMNGARDLFTRNVIEDTMFAYDKIHNPQLYRGLLGRMIGQYGVFAVQYIQNVKKGLTMGPLADRVAYGTRLAAVNAALLYTAKTLGIDASRDFLPWSPAQFTGGPMFNLALDVWGSMGSGYQADQARARLKKALPVGWTHKNGRFEWTGPQVPTGPLGTAVPFAAQFRALNKAAGYLEKGEPWLAFLAVSGAPITDEYRK